MMMSPVSSHLVVRACIEGCIEGCTLPDQQQTQTHGTATLWMPPARVRAKPDRLQAQTDDPSVTSQILSLSSSSHGMRSDSMPGTAVFNKFFSLHKSCCPQMVTYSIRQQRQTTAVVKFPAWSPQHFGYNTYRRRTELATAPNCTVT